MSSAVIATVVKMMESLPEAAQEQVVEYLRQYIQDLQDEARWDNLFRNTPQQLMIAAQQAKQEIAEGRAEPLDYDRL